MPDTPVAVLVRDHAPRTLAGNRPLRLDGQSRLLRVTEGRVSVHAIRLGGDGAPTGTRLHVVTVGPGDTLPGWPETGRGIGLFAVAIGAAQVVPVERAEAASERAVLDGLDAVLAAFGGQAAAEIPAGAHWIEPGETITADRRRVIVGHRVTWAVRGAELGAVPGAVPEDALAPRLLTPCAWLTVEEGATIRALSTADALARFGWAPVDTLCGAALARLHAEIGRSDQEARERIEARVGNDESTVRNAVRAAVGVLGDADDTGADPTLGSADAADTALRWVAHDLRIPLRPLPDVGGNDEGLTAWVQRHARASGFRCREIALPDRWWRQDFPSFVGAWGETGVPCAVLRRGAGRFEVVMAGGRRQRVTAEVAGRLGAGGISLYRTLPAQALGVRDILSFALSGSASDLATALILTVVTVLLGLLTPVVTGILVNEAVPFAETASIAHMALGLTGIAVGSAMFALVRAVLLLRFEGRADAQLQAGVWDRLLKLPAGFFRGFSTGDLLMRALSPTSLRRVVSDTLFSSGLSCVFSVVNFALMLTYDGRLALGAVAVTALAAVLLAGVGLVQLRFERRTVERAAETSSALLDILTALSTVRVNGAEDRMFARWLGLFGAQRREAFRAGLAGGAFAVLNALVPLLATLVFFLIVASVAKTVSVGDFVAFNAAFGQFIGAVLGMVTALTASLDAVPIIKRMRPILDAVPETTENRPAAGTLHGRVALSGVTFRYGDGPPVLEDVGFTAEPGAFVALVGSSGSGKSTLFRLLLGFETPERGSVSYDGQSLADVDPASVRRQLGVVLQKGTLLPGSILENIVGSAPLGIDEAWEAVRMAGLEEDVRAMPMGLHTLLSDGAATLSGGQRQRLMIARAIVRKPCVLLLDEATSALDNRTQAIVADSLARLNATRIVIAHRLSTVVHADEIVVLEAGRVVQRGTYGTLMEQDGPFRTLARRQLMDG